MPGFTHLHTASGYSVRYGASHPARLAERAAERGMDALALTDRDTVAGAVRFAKACATAGVRPLFGADLAYEPAAPHPDGAPSRNPGSPSRTPGAPPAPGAPGAPGASGASSASARARRETSARRAPVRGGAFVDESAPRAVFLARSRAGWAGLCARVTAAHARAGDGPPVLPWSAHTGDGLFVLLGPGSDIGRALAAGRPDRAARLLAPWRERYGDALCLEAVHHGLAGTGPGSLRLAARTVGFAAEQGVRPVLGNGVRYADPGQGPVADVLDAARRLVPVDPRAGLDSGEAWLKEPGAMREAAERIAEAAGFRRDAAYRLLERTEEVAAACRVDPEDDLGMGSAHFPEPYLVGAAHRTAQRVLASRAAAGLLLKGYDRGPDRRVYWDRMHHELDIIAHHGFASYFLTVARVVDDVRGMGIRVAARGSGAGSLVNHLLGIAHADPVAHGLLMERFLSKRRTVLPDIDIDVESARRLEVYRAILGRFGAERVAAVAMPETYRVRHAVRDVGAALSMDPAETDRIAKAFPHIRARDARAALAELPELRGLRAELAGRGRPGERFWELVEALDALPRGTAMHPCGVLLSDASLLTRTPVVPTSGEGLPMSLFDKEDVEDLGLLKLDVLGVRMQSAMAHAVAEVGRVTGTRPDIDAIPPGDGATYELIRSAETLGCFQIESPGQRDLVGRLQPADFHDLVVDISLFRPGPVAADMVRPFIEARHGRAPVRCPHPDLEDALKETYGVVVFHEQIIEIVSVMTGCGRDEADQVRRGLSDPGARGRIKAWFAERAGRRGYAPEVVARTWGIVEAFGSYGFCKAHAVAFAVPTYQSAWLKAHHPAAFYAGLLTHDPGMYPKRLLLADARRRGVPVLPVDVNRSAVAHRIELVSGKAGAPDAVWGLRLGLADVHGIGEAESARIETGAPYGSLLDFWERARPRRPVAERLARVGALDSFGTNRRDLLLHLAELHRARRKDAAHGGQLPLAEGLRTAPVGLPDLDGAERLSAELGVLGMDASRHLMGDHAEFLRELGVVPARRLRSAEHGRTVLVAGAKVATQTPPILRRAAVGPYGETAAREPQRIVFVTLDDATGLVDLAFFADSQAGSAHTVFHSGLLLVRGKVQRRGPRSLSVAGSAAWDLAELAELRRTGGLDAVAARLAGRPGTGGAGASAGAAGAGAGAGGAEPDGGVTSGRGRTLRVADGVEMNPWSDLRPAGGDCLGGRKLWHSSPGSAG
ncbi:DNA polymerase III subunit alpha [Streptomyces sp. NPDC048717]|uniref:DNA polymerase III subunit alpha n=1 Tax=Streptomyces sp. NPDC048717 TaxID=3154928 RepID=UPI00342B625B